MKGSIIVDPAGFSKEGFPFRTFRVDSKIWKSIEQEHLNMGDEDFLICDNQLFGFALDDQVWCRFNVSHARQTEPNPNSFACLVIPDGKKATIAALVMEHRRAAHSFDDHVKGKGQGLIFLLHGPPGVGKTFTAGQFTTYLVRYFQHRKCQSH